MALRIYSVIVFASLLVVAAGCHRHQASTPNACDPVDLMANQCGPSYMSLGNEPDLACEVCAEEEDTGLSPLDVSDYTQIHYREVTLQECIQHALVNSKVFRDLGGTILTTPEVTTGVFDPAITYTDPLFSEEAALSAFDANVSAAAFFQNNDQASNLTFQGNNGIFVQDFHDYQFELQKLSATGSLFTLRNLTNYDNSNQTGQTLPHSWSTVFEGEVRQPLLQGAGVLFNRIAGPSRQPGVYGGVLIARTNTEITLSRFEEGVRNLISEVENAYWDLYFSYRNLEAVIEGRDKAHEILIATTEGKAREGSQAQAQAKEQYLRFEADVLDAMEGRPTFGTRNNNGMSGGVFLSNGGIRVAERRLRLVCGLPINEGMLLRTSDDPASTGIQFDWNTSISEAFNNRQELRQQRWLIKQNELQLLAAKNFLRPRLDLVGQYRFRGLGRSLTADSNSFTDDLLGGTETSSAFYDLYTGDFQEWQVGAEFSMPLGFRRAHLGVRNAEISLSREQALLKEQKREVQFGLSNAFGEARRAYTALKASEEQYIAAREFQYVMQLEVERGRDRDIELEAQRRVVEAEIAYRQAQVEYMLAVKNIHFEKGTYLKYCNIRLSESQSNPKAARDAAARAARRGRKINYVLDTPIIARAKPLDCGCVESCNCTPTSEIPTDSILGDFSPGEFDTDSVLEPMDDAPFESDVEPEIEVTPEMTPSPNESPNESLLESTPPNRMLEDTRFTPSGINTFNMSDIPDQPRFPEKPQIQMGYGDDFTSLPPQLLVPNDTIESNVLPLPTVPDQLSVAESIAIPTFEPAAKPSIKLTSGQKRVKKSSRRQHQAERPQVTVPKYEPPVSRTAAPVASEEPVGKSTRRQAIKSQ